MMSMLFLYREVPVESGKRIAEKWKVPFIEASAKENQVSHWGGGVVVGEGQRNGRVATKEDQVSHWDGGVVVRTEKWKVPFIEASAKENQVSHWGGCGGGGREMEGSPLKRTR